MIRSLDKKFHNQRRSVIRLFAIFLLLAAGGLTFAMLSRSVAAGPSPSRRAVSGERTNHRISMHPELAAASPVLTTPFFAAITVDRTDDTAAASACTAAANDC